MISMIVVILLNDLNCKISINVIVININVLNVKFIVRNDLEK